MNLCIGKAVLFLLSQLVGSVRGAGSSMSASSLFIVGLASFFIFNPSGGFSQAKQRLSIVIGEKLDAPASFAVDKLLASLAKKGLAIQKQKSIDATSSPTVVLIGTSRDRVIKDMIKAGDIQLSEKKESLSVKRLNKGQREVLVIAGSDDRGLMYALLEAARQVEAGAGGGALDAIRNISESPLVPVRSMVLFLHNADDEESWYYSKQYWEDYFSMLATNRWNTFNLVFSHQTSYLAPMYPFHVKIDKYANVKANGLTDAKRMRNMEMLRFISSLARDRGMDFTLSVWQQIAWDAGTEFPDSQESMVTGYTKENMTDYTYLAMKEILRECPGITGLQLRLNYESGVDYASQTAFFKNAVFRAAKESGRKILIEVRDIGLLSETLDAALSTGLPTRVSHKYWAEDLVFPYHPTKFVWTYSYGDWLKYPRNADQIYQVWSLGSHRIFPWGDPEFVKRFAPTTIFQDAVGFEICAPLSQKGFGNQPGAWRIFEDREREYYTWEFERYWSYYQLFGRLTYNPDVAEDFWVQEIQRRFGSRSANAIAEAYKSASQVVPHIVATAISNFNMYVWPEKDMGGLINYYLTLRPFDRALFSGFEEHADNVLAGRYDGKQTPIDVANKLDSISAQIETSLDAARTLVERGEKEFWTADRDFRILAGMARYFSQKMRATVNLALYYRTGDINQLRTAIKHGKQGLAEWKRLSVVADEIYSDNLVFGPGSAGHWKDNIAFVEEDLKTMEYQEELFSIIQNADYAFDFGPAAFTRNTETYSTPYTNDFTVERRFKGVFPHTNYDPQTGYGWVEAGKLTAPEARNLHRNTWSGATRAELENVPRNALMGDYIMGDGEATFRLDLPEGHYQGAVILTDKSAKPTDHGPMEVFVVERFGDRPIVDSKVIRAGEIVIKRFNINMTGERFINFRIKFKANSGGHFIVNALTFTKVEPHIAHVPIRKSVPLKDVLVTASVTLPPPPNDEHPLTSLGIITSNASTLEVPSEVSRVSLKYSLSAVGPFKRIDLKSSEKASYRGAIPAMEAKEGEVYYYLEAEDNTGRIVRLPAEKDANAHYRIDVTGDHAPPSLSHTPVKSHTPGKPLQLSVRATDKSGVKTVTLYFRPTRQTMEYTAVTMDRVGDEYAATIPGGIIKPDFDIMYYFEATDIHGNACIRPNREVETPYHIVNISR